MCTIRHFLSAALIVVLTITTIGAGLSVSAQERPYRISQQQEVDQLLRRIETRSTQFRQSLYAALNQSRIDGTRQEDNINEFVRNFETATATLRDRFRQRRDVAGDVSEVLAQAAFIDRFMGRHRLAANAEENWSGLRSDLDGLARYYNVTWSWDAGTGERPYRISQQQEVDQLLRRIETRSTQFRQSLYAALNQSRIDGTRQEDNINEFVRNFETATATLRDRFRQRRDVGSDVSEVLAQAAFIDRFMGRHRLAANAEQDWSALRSDLDGLARYYNVAWSWDAGTGERPYRISQQQEVDQLLRRIETRSTQFRQSLYAALNQSRIDGTRQEDNINEFVRDFETATATLRDRFRQRRDVGSDVSEVLAKAAFIDRFMGRHRLAANAEQDWSALRSDLDGLARYYNVAWSWDAGTGRGPGSSRLTGTYRLDPNRSDRVGRAAKIATRGLSPEEQQRVRDMLSRRLEAPEMLAIERNGRNVTIASSRAPQVTVEADGRDRIEQTPRGRSIRVNAALNLDQLVIASTGDSGNDYSVTFEPLDNGRQLRVTRRIDAENLSQPVMVTSYYNKTSEVAQLDLYTEAAPVAENTRGRSPLPDSTQLVATLDNDLTTRQARAGDRFTMTVRSPSVYDGAVIEGHLARVDRGGRVSGRSELAMNFDRIRLRGGATQSFDGYIESVRASNGEDVRVDNEGIVSERDSQSTRTVTRTGIGAAVGALIGAIAGGGKGAAIGAAVGAGTGAGSVFIQGRDDLELTRGTEFTIRASLPGYRQGPGE